jgi:hypothetical protein
MDRSLFLELPKVLGAFDALLHAGETDIGQLAVIEQAELLPRPLALAPQRERDRKGGSGRGLRPQSDEGPKAVGQAHLKVE